MLQFVAEHTSIPVPKVYHAFTCRGKTYILMERIRVDNMQMAWHSLSDASKASLFKQLRQMIHELRSIVPETCAVSNIDGGPIFDCRLPTTCSQGPFKSVHDFHLALRNNVTARSLESPGSQTSPIISDVRKLITLHEFAVQPPVLTHGDLSSFNILVHDDKVVGIINWESSGWLPHYWEYTTAENASPQITFWQKEVHNFLDTYKEEWTMEKLRREYFGDISEFLC